MIADEIVRCTKFQVVCPNCGHVGPASWTRTENLVRCRGCGEPFDWRGHTYRPVTGGMTDEERLEHTREMARAYNAEHREERAEKARAWREAHPEHVKAYNRAYREAHREKRAAQAKAWREAHPEQVRTYREAHREKRASHGKENR